MRPDSDPGEEMGLRRVEHVVSHELNDRPQLHAARRDVAGVDEVREPTRRVRLDLVVESGPHYRAPHASAHRAATWASCARPLSASGRTGRPAAA